MARGNNHQIIYLGTDNWQVPNLKHYKTEYNKLWSSDSGRSLDGTNHKTLIGVFPKLTVDVGEFTQQQMAKFLSYANAENVVYKFYDEASTNSNKMTTVTSGAYITDAVIELKNTKYMTYKGFTFSIVPDKKR